MRASIPELKKKLRPLTHLLEQVLSLAGSRTKRRAAQIKLEEELWTQKHQQNFDAIMQSLVQSVTLAHIDSHKILCLFTETSDVR